MPVTSLFLAQNFPTMTPPETESPVNGPGSWTAFLVMIFALAFIVPSLLYFRADRTVAGVVLFSIGSLIPIGALVFILRSLAV